MKDQIVDKLDVYIKKHTPFREECEVVYLMVELRKLLDREGKNNNQESLIRFYADWIVHTEKSKYISPNIRLIMNDIDKQLQSKPQRKELETKFFLLPELKDELQNLFRKQHLFNSMIQKNCYWKDFVYLLTQILADQPLKIINHPISEFRYWPNQGIEKTIIVTINFSDKERKPLSLGGDLDLL